MYESYEYYSDTSEKLHKRYVGIRRYILYSTKDLRDKTLAAFAVFLEPQMFFQEYFKEKVIFDATANGFLHIPQGDLTVKILPLNILYTIWYVTNFNSQSTHACTKILSCNRVFDMFTFSHYILNISYALIF